MPTIKSISENESAEYKEDVTVEGSLGKGSSISVKDGKLHIKGSVEAGAKIKMTITPQPPQIIRGGGFSSMIFGGGSITINGVNIVGGGSDDKYSLTIDGDVGENATIECAGMVTVHGKVAQKARIKTQAGHISTGDVANKVNISSTNGTIELGSVGAGSSINSTNGNINCGSVADDSRVSTTNGNVHCNDVGQDAEVSTTNGNVVAKNVSKGAAVKSVNGNVKVTEAHENADLSTVSGYVSVNGVKRKREFDGGSVCISGISFGSFGGSVRVIDGSGREYKSPGYR